MKTEHTKELLHTDSTRILAKSGKIVACTEFADYSVEEAWANADFIVKACNAYADNQDTIAELVKALGQGLIDLCGRCTGFVSCDECSRGPVKKRFKAALAKVGG